MHLVCAERASPHLCRPQTTSGTPLAESPPLRIIVPREYVGHIIGRAGAHINSVKADTGADIHVDQLTGDFTSYGPSSVHARV